MDKSATPIGDDPYYQKIQKILDTAKDDESLFKAIVNAPFHDKLRAIQIDLGNVVLSLVNSGSQTIDRIALSHTYANPGVGILHKEPMPIKKLKIPLGHTSNVISKAIKAGTPQFTDNWRYLFIPALSGREAKFRQASTGIECSFVYPINGMRQGAIVYNFYQPLTNIGSQHHTFMQYYAKLVSSIL